MIIINMTKYINFSKVILIFAEFKSQTQLLVK